MDSKKDFPELNRELYPDIEPYSTGFLKVSDLHTIYWEQSGNPNGHLFFSMEAQEVELHQITRGAGKSTLHACLVENTTWNLVNDIEKIREHLQIPEWQVFGGSWGSTLALAYSQAHPERGRYDVCCTMMSAWDLHRAWPEAELIVVPDAGHSANELGIAAELVGKRETEIYRQGECTLNTGLLGMLISGNVLKCGPH